MGFGIDTKSDVMTVTLTGPSDKYFGMAFQEDGDTANMLGLEAYLVIGGRVDAYNIEGSRSLSGMKSMSDADSGLSEETCSDADGETTCTFKLDKASATSA